MALIAFVYVHFVFVKPSRHLLLGLQQVELSAPLRHPISKQNFKIHLSFYKYFSTQLSACKFLPWIVTAIFHTVPPAYICYDATYNCAYETVYYTYTFSNYHSRRTFLPPIITDTDLPDNAIDCKGTPHKPHRGIILDHTWTPLTLWSDQCYEKRKRLRTDFTCWDWVVGSLAISTFIVTLLAVVLAAVVRIRRFNINT